MNNMKKDLQKVTKMFRNSLPDVAQYYSDGTVRKVCKPAYPKAMMTASQMRKNTATINCDWVPGSYAMAESFLTFGPFVDWCKTYGIKSATKESVKVGESRLGPIIQWQVRVIY